MKIIPLQELNLNPIWLTKFLLEGDCESLCFKGINGIYNFELQKPSYKTELRIMKSQIELLTLKFYFLKLL